MKTKITDTILGWIGPNERPTAFTGAGWQPLFEYGLYSPPLGMQNCTRAARNELVTDLKQVKARAASHWALFLGYGGFTAAYLLAAFR